MLAFSKNMFRQCNRPLPRLSIYIVHLQKLKWSVHLLVNIAKKSASLYQQKKLIFNSSKSPHQIFSVDIHCDSILQILPSKNVYVSYTLILESNLYLAIMSLNYSSQILVTKLYTVILNASKHEINIKMSDLFVVLLF